MACLKTADIDWLTDILKFGRRRLLHDDGLRSGALNAHIVPEFVEPVLKRIDGWCIHNMLREIVPSVDDALTEEVFPNVQSDIRLVQLHTVSSKVVTRICKLEEVTNINTFFRPLKSTVERCSVERCCIMVSFSPWLSSHSLHSF